MGTVVAHCPVAAIRASQRITVDLGGNLGSVEHPLSNVVNGRSDTTIDVSLPDLLSSQSAINVHRSASQANVYVPCGEITE